MDQPPHTESSFIHRSVYIKPYYFSLSEKRLRWVPREKREKIKIMIWPGDRHISERCEQQHKQDEVRATEQEINGGLETSGGDNPIHAVGGNCQGACMGMCSLRLWNHDESRCTEWESKHGARDATTTETDSHGECGNANDRQTAGRG